MLEKIPVSVFGKKRQRWREIEESLRGGTGVALLGAGGGGGGGAAVIYSLVFETRGYEETRGDEAEPRREWYFGIETYEEESAWPD